MKLATGMELGQTLSNSANGSTPWIELFYGALTREQPFCIIKQRQQKSKKKEKEIETGLGCKPAAANEQPGLYIPGNTPLAAKVHQLTARKGGGCMTYVTWTDLLSLLLVLIALATFVDRRGK